MDECVCALFCLSCAPKCGCCAPAPDCPAIDSIRRGDTVDPAVAETMEERGGEE